MSTKGDWVSYHYYVGLLKISEDKVGFPPPPAQNKTPHKETISLIFFCV